MEEIQEGNQMGGVTNSGTAGRVGLAKWAPRQCLLNGQA